MRVFLILIGWLAGASTLLAEEPLIDHQPVICSLPGKHIRICSYVADDGEIKRVRAYFRAERQEFFYWTPMVFDGIQYCATLPVAEKKVRGVEYYLWAIDDEFESHRTRTYEISLVPEAPCEYPVFDEDPERTRNLVVNATSHKQGDSIDSFHEKGIVRFISVPKKK